MEKDFDALSVEFNDRATSVYFILYQEFEAATRTLNRQKSENIFQQNLNMYLTTLKSRLEFIAKDIVNKNGLIEDINQLQHYLFTSIENYVNEFRYKAVLL